MDNNTKKEIKEIENDLNGIIKHLQIISVGMKQDSLGIGQDECYSSVIAMASGYKYIKDQISQIK